ncbi:hypothetical protein [Brucella gallinifaecis]|uniref:hypothetical protein n=1 Tax=Brucella gallinifaecis TaxID=215590 RepID=UPI00235DD2AC|nr:hypothetical protein [Brucella gallinifaecis]
MTQNNKRIISDPVFLTLLIVLLINVIIGGALWQKLAASSSLGPGWPELLQGISGFLVLILLLIRALQLSKRTDVE